MAQTTPPVGSEAHTKLLTMVRDRVRMCERHRNQFSEQWQRNENLYRAYVDPHAKDKDGKLLYPNGRDIILPLSYAVCQTILTYLMSVFTMQTPMFPIKATDPGLTSDSDAMSTVIEYQLRNARGVAVIYNWLQDVLKHGFGMIVNTWEVSESPRSRRELVAEFEGGVPIGMREVESEYMFRDERNAPRNIDPRVAIYDPRVSAFSFHEGEFAGHTMHRSYNQLLRNEYDSESGIGFYSNLAALKEDAAQRGSGSQDTSRQATAMDMHPSEVLDFIDKGNYPLNELEMWIVPAEYGLGAGSYPEKWIVVLCNDRVIIRAEKSPYPTDDFNSQQMEFLMDGHSARNPGLIQVIEGMQQTIDWLLNAHMDNVRRALNDAFIVNPNLVEIRDILNPDAARIIRLKKSALGIPDVMNQAIQQLRITDVTKTHMKDAMVIIDLVQRVMPATDIQMGVPTKSRKTLGEVQNLLMQSSSRLRLLAQLLSATGIKPWIQSCVRNTQAFMQDSRYYRIAGGKDEVTKLISPYEIQGDFELIATDGATPTDPASHIDTWKELLLAVAQDPELRQVFDITQLFKHMAELAGVKNIDDYIRKQGVETPQGMQPGQRTTMPDEQIQKQVQKGNLVGV